MALVFTKVLSRCRTPSLHAACRRPAVFYFNDSAMSHWTLAQSTQTWLTASPPVHAYRRFATVKGKWGVVNEQITASVVQVVDEDGKMLRNVPLQEALTRAKNQGVDLVQVSQNGKQVVCRMFDAKKRLFAMKKAVKAQKPKQDKEVVFGVNIASHDIKVKAEQVKKFLSKGHKVKVTVKFGTQYHMKEKAMEQMQVIQESIPDTVGVPDQATKEQFGGVFVFFAPAKSK